MHEALRVRSVGGEKGLLARRDELLGHTVVHRRGRHQTDPRVAMLVVVVAEEGAAKGPSVLNRTETPRKLWAVLQRLELRFGVGVVVGDVRPRVGLGHAQVGQQHRQRLAAHRSAAVGVDRQLARLDALTTADRFDQATPRTFCPGGRSTET